MTEAEISYPITAEVMRAQTQLGHDERADLIDRIKALLVAQNATLVAHYYTHSDVQMIADETGGCVADSLEMARFGSQQDATTLVVAGVRFMGETAKILSPEKRVVMPPGGDLLPRSRLPGRSFLGFLRREPRPHGSGLCEYECRSKSAFRLGGYIEYCGGRG